MFIPNDLNEFIGQEQLKEKIRIYAKAAQLKGKPFPHTILFGPPGYGKTTAARLIAKEMNTRIVTQFGGNIQNLSDVLMLMKHAIIPKSILFIDEIHRLKDIVEEGLYQPMNSFSIDLKTPDGSMGTFLLPEFSLIGATTLPGDISEPLRSRCTLLEVKEYNNEEMLQLINMATEAQGYQISNDAKPEVLCRGRNIPRRVLQLLDRLEDFRMATDETVVNKKVALEYFKLTNIDNNGLEDIDRDYLKYLDATNRPTGIKALATALQTDETSITDIIEPYLIKEQLVFLTGRGRVITAKGRSCIDANVKTILEYGG